jgi:hypothetical protein
MKFYFYEFQCLLMVRFFIGFCRISRVILPKNDHFNTQFIVVTLGLTLPVLSQNIKPYLCVKHRFMECWMFMSLGRVFVLLERYLKRFLSFFFNGFSKFKKKFNFTSVCFWKLLFLKVFVIIFRFQSCSKDILICIVNGKHHVFK